MSKIGRNQPCPCGSGKKYKRCCLDGGLGGYTKAERVAALTGLFGFANQPQWLEDAEDALEEHWGPFIDHVDEVRDEGLMAMSKAALDFWFAFDFLLARDDRRLVDWYLQLEPDLPLAHERYLEAMAKTAVRLYEVTSVRPSASLTLRDLIEGSEIEVRERLASQSLRRWDVIATRVLPIGASGYPEMDGGVLPIPRSRVPDLLALVREQREDFPKTPQGELEFCESLPPLFHQCWIQPAVASSLPQLANFDGEPVVFTEVCFEALDRERLTAALDRAEARERNGTERVWSWPGRGRDRKESISRGFVELRDERLVLTTNSHERGERGRGLVEEIVGSAIRYLTTTTMHPHQAMAEGRSGGKTRPGAPQPTPEDAEVLQRAKEEYYQDYYRSWLDDSVPMLDGQTPRQAAESESLRPRLVGMLKDLEQMYERSLDEGEPGFDPSWMWSELGLDSDREAVTASNAGTRVDAKTDTRARAAGQRACRPLA